MNARNEVFTLILEGNLTFDVLSALFNTIILNRSYGKFVYNSENSFSVSNVGIIDLDCNFLDYTYTACSSKALQGRITQDLNIFCDMFHKDVTRNIGEISLEFYQKKKNRWSLFQPEIIPWEIWTMKVELITITDSEERRLFRDKVTQLLCERNLYINDLLNRYDYVPEIPSSSQLTLTFDTSYDDVQPYLFKFNYSTSKRRSPSISTTMKKFLAESL